MDMGHIKSGPRLHNAVITLCLRHARTVFWALKRVTEWRSSLALAGAAVSATWPLSWLLCKNTSALRQVRKRDQLFLFLF